MVVRPMSVKPVTGHLAHLYPALLRGDRRRAAEQGARILTAELDSNMTLTRCLDRAAAFVRAAVLALAPAVAIAGQTLLVISDTGDCDEPGAAQVAAALKRQVDWQSALLVEVGDLAYPAATLERLKECHEPHFAAFRRIAVPGNHDWRDPYAAGFFALFPEPLPRHLDLAAPWRLLLLDSNLRDAAWQDQLAWLDTTLAASAGKCLIAFWHHPRWSSGRHGDNAFTAPLWSRLAGVASFSVHGHDHHFEALPRLDHAGRPAADGLLSFIAGNGGARLYSAGKQARSQRAHYGRWGFLRIDLDGQRFAWQAIAVDGSRIDAGSDACRPLPRRR